jgi:hypothetical protein
MTRNEIVQTALLACLTASEHEVRERFTYQGHAIFGPHFDIDALAGVAAAGIAFDVRPASDTNNDGEPLETALPVSGPILRGGRFTCPKGHSHDRGPVNGAHGYRCLACGDSWNMESPSANSDLVPASPILSTLGVLSPASAPSALNPEVRL